MKDVIVQNIIESMSIGLIVINAEGEIIITNPAAETILGFSQEVLKAKGWAKLFFEMKGNTAFNQVIVDVIESQKIKKSQKVPYIKPNGEQLHLTITCSFLREQQKPVGIVMLFDDVSEIHHLHEHEKNILEERHRLQHERVESLKHFAMSVAHQIRNPLVSIGGYSKRLLRCTEQNDTDRIPLEYILEEVKRLEDIVRTVEEYTALANIERKMIFVNDIIDQVRSEIDRKASEISKKITWDVNLEVRDIFVDPVFFTQALIEILKNSLESFPGHPPVKPGDGMKPSGTIRILAKKVKDTTIIELSDNGAGVKQKDIRYVFDPFFTTKVKNIGMGLSKAQRIISEHRGKITVKSKPGSGTKVTITLPDNNRT